MLFWKKAPFARWFIALCAGSIAAVCLKHWPYRHWLFLLILAFCAFLFFRLKRKLFVQSYPLWSGISALLLCFAFGAFRLSYWQGQGEKEFLKLQKHETQAYRGQVCGKIEDKQGYWRFDVNLEAIKTKKGEWLEARATVKQKIYKGDSLGAKPVIGDVWLFDGKLKEVFEPLNPGSFDYKKYLKNQNIYFIGAVDTENCSRLEAGGWSVRRWAFQARTYFESVIDLYLKDAPPEAGLLKALLLGAKDGLGEEAKNDFSTSGAMHLLAVSGLHVGIFMEVVALLTVAFRKRKNARIAYFLLSLLLLWGYAFVTGFSPSVQRAALMISFLEFSRLSDKAYSSYNSLFSAAFFLLVAEPGHIYSLGFQLSFLSLFGILYFYPKISGLVFISNVWVRKTWQLFSVSLAAQLVVSPLCLFIFHKFPVYFWLSNLLLSPLVFVVLLLGFALLFLSPFPMLCAGVAYILKWILMMAMRVAHNISSLPFNEAEVYWIGGKELFLLYFLMFSFILYIEFRKFSFLFCSLASVVLLLMVSFVDVRLNDADVVLTTYAYKKSPNVVFSEGGRFFFIARFSGKADNKGYLLQAIKKNNKSSALETLDIPEKENVLSDKMAFIKIKGSYLLVRRKNIVYLQTSAESAEIPLASGKYLLADGKRFRKLTAL